MRRPRLRHPKPDADASASRRTVRTPAPSSSGSPWTSSTSTVTTAAVVPRGGAVRAAQPGRARGRLPGEPVLPAGVPRPARRRTARRATAGCCAASELGVEDLPGFGDDLADNAPCRRGREPGGRRSGTPIEAHRERGRGRPARPGPDGAVDRPDWCSGSCARCRRNTYVVLTSDNGFHLGQHGLGVGKGAAYDSDIRVPLLVVGPGVRPGGARRGGVEHRPGADVRGPRRPRAARRYRSGDSLVPTLRRARRWSAADYAFVEHTWSASPVTTPTSPRRHASTWCRRTSPCAAVDAVLIRYRPRPGPRGRPSMRTGSSTSTPTRLRAHEHLRRCRTIPGRARTLLSAGCKRSTAARASAGDDRRAREECRDAAGSRLCRCAAPDVVVVDHHDSYTWNLVHLSPPSPACCRGSSSTTRWTPRRARAQSRRPVARTRASRTTRRTSRSVARCCRAGTVPVLGVCLGMQGLVTAYGGTVDRDARPRGGGPDRPRRRGRLPPGCRRGSRPSATTRSRRSTLPDCLVATAHVPGDRTGPGDGGAARRPAAGGRAVPPRVDPVRARRRDGRELPGACARGSGSADPVAYFREVAAAHPRCFWLDGGGAREWSGRRSIIGWLDEDDVSLTYDAARGAR